VLKLLGHYMFFLPNSEIPVFVPNLIRRYIDVGNANTLSIL
jgi:hypothetical protein